MAELAVLGLFVLALCICVIFNTSLLYALLFGLLLFFGYGLWKGNRWSQMLKMALSGILTVKNILLTFLLIGIITALWRSCGTIGYIVYYATKLCAPSVMVLATFLLCCLVSFLTGTSFGTAATAGVICSAMAASMGVPAIYIGGAVLAGSFFGDRCSPMSTSALLVSNLTKTDLYSNMLGMVKTSWVPFGITCLIYLGVGLSIPVTRDTSGVQELFASHFIFHPTLLIPVAAILLMSFLRCNVKLTMSVSIICSAAVAILVQKVSVPELLKTAMFGYQPDDPQVSALLSGGGISSMINVFCIVLISSCYAGIFQGTGLLDGIRQALKKAGGRITPFGGIWLASVLTGVISCNQTLCIMLTHQLCGTLEEDPKKMALHLENTAVVMSPLIPWSIACSVPLAAIGAPLSSVALACYLYLIPVWNLFVCIYREKGTAPVDDQN